MKAASSKLTPAEKLFINELSNQKRCGSCKQRKDLSEFTISYNNSIGYCNVCRVQQNAQSHRGTTETQYLIRDTQWQLEGQCATEDVDLDVFFPSSPLQILSEDWNKHCDECPVWKECADFGVKFNMSGVWGGIFLNGLGYLTEIPDVPLDYQKLVLNYSGPVRPGTICSAGHVLESWDDIVLRRCVRPDKVEAECSKCSETP